MNPYDDDAPTNVQGTPPPSSGQPANADQKSAITAAVVGTAALGGAAYAMSHFLDDGTPQEQAGADSGTSETLPPSETTTAQTITATQTTTGTETTSGTGIGANTLPDHEKTFDEAFAEARAEHGGGGGFFEFDRDGDGKKEYYSTYLDSEWGKLDHHEKQEFYATVPDYHSHGGGDGGVSGALHPDTGIAHHNTVPPPVDDIVVIGDDDEGSVEVDPDNTQVAQVSDESTRHQADIARIHVNGEELLVVDVDHDDNPDGVFNPDTHIALIDTDHDAMLDTRVEFDQDFHVIHAEHMSEALPTVSMQSIHEDEQQIQEPESDLMLADNSDFGSDFDNHADTSDFDYEV